MNDIEIIRRIWFYAKKYKYYFAITYIVLLVELATGQILPLFLADVINATVYDLDMQLFLISTTYYSIIFIIHIACGFIQLQLWQRVNNYYVYDIRLACYRKVLRLKPHILGDIKTGDIIKTINDDTAEFHHIIQRFGMRIINAGIGTTISLVIVAIMKWEIALFMALVIPISALISKNIQKQMKKACEQVREKQGKYVAWIMEILSGMQEVKLFAAENNILRIFIKKNHDIVRTKTKQEYIQFKANEVINAIYFITDILFYIICALFVVKGEINVGDYIAISTYFTMVTYSIKRILYGNVDYQRRKTCVERVINLLNEKDENEEGLNDLVVNEGRIEIRGVSFAYDNENRVLENINLKINPGEKIGLVGQSGIGKSTLANLILKFYEWQEGDIFVDDQNLKHCKSTSIRQSIGIVRQENVIFDLSVRENVTLGKEVPDEIIWDILDKVYLKEEIEGLPNGLDTVLGNNGVSLSGGQYQRVCIARLFLRNPRIIILDEATSALDRQSEEIVQKALDILMKGKTAIVISHRNRALINMDKILVLHKGRQVGYDSYDRLLTTNQHFKDLFLESKAVIK